MSNKLKIALIVIIALMAGLGVAAAWRITVLSGQLQTTTEQLDFSKKGSDLLEEKLADFMSAASSTKPAPAPAVPLAPTSTDIFQNAQNLTIATSTRDALKNLLPLSIGNIDQALELSPGVVAVVAEDPHGGSRVWEVDLDTNSLKIMSPLINTNYGSDIRIARWSDGVQIEEFSSPGEAVETVDTSFVDRAGKVIGEAVTGDFNRGGSVLDFTIGQGPQRHAKLLQGTCSGDFYDPSTGGTLPADRQPTTTLTGIEVNSSTSPLPHVVVTTCGQGYGDVVQSIEIGEPSFDGKRMSFDIPGYAVSIDAEGGVSYTAKNLYWLTCEYGYGDEGNGIHDVAPMALYHQDGTGDHLVLSDAWKDPTLTALRTGEYCFSSAGTSNGLAHFTIQNQTMDTGSVDYDIRSGKFKNLLLQKKD